jgi:hypothetical protein
MALPAGASSAVAQHFGRMHSESAPGRRETGGQRRCEKNGCNDRKSRRIGRPDTEQEARDRSGEDQRAYRAISGHLIRKAGLTRASAVTGAVTLIQRFGSALNLNVHFHMLVLDGVYRREGEGGLRPSKSAIVPICQCTAHLPALGQRQPLGLRKNAIR